MPSILNFLRFRPHQALCLFLLLFMLGLGAAPKPSIALDDLQKETLEAVSDYFSDLTDIRGRFIQQEGVKGRASGVFSLSKPGKIRFDYDPPSQVKVVSDGSSVLIEDGRIGSQDVYGLAQTPLKFLVDEDLDLARDTKVTEVYVDPDQVVVVIEDAPGANTGKLTMVFSGQDYTLLQWSVLDNKGKETTVFVDGLEEVDGFPRSTFAINYNKLKQFQNPD